MATLTRGQTFGATETITNTKLHNLVDSATISSIINADCDASMGLVDTKLADITTGGKVRGTAIANLASIPSSAGYLPAANIPILNMSIMSLVSIANTSLRPITLASYVDGAALRNLASTPVDQQIRYNLLVSSLASGSLPMYNGVNNFVGGLFLRQAVIAQFSGVDAVGSSGPGVYFGSLTSGVSGWANMFFCSLTAAAPGGNYLTQTGMIQFIKTPTINTLSIYTRTWCDNYASNYTIAVSVGALSEVTQDVTANQNAPTDRAVITVDVSTLTNGTKYPINILSRSTSGGVKVFMSKYLIVGDP